MGLSLVGCFRNNILFAGVVLSFFGVLASLLPEAHVAALTATANWVNVPRAIPTLLLSWYELLHNVTVPILFQKQD